MPMPTREQERERKRAYRARLRDEAEANKVTGTDVQDGVRAELDTLPQAAQMLAASATAMALARVLDDPDSVPQHPAAAAQLRMTMAEIRAAKMLGGESKLTLIRGGRRAK